MPEGTERSLTRAPPRPVKPSQALSRASYLVSGITRDAAEIIEGYLELARYDLRAEIAQVKSSLTVTLASALVLAAGAGALLVGVCLALAFLLGIRAFWTFSGVGLLGLITGGALGALALKRARKIEKPPALREAKEDVKWIAEHT